MFEDTLKKILDKSVGRIKGTNKSYYTIDTPMYFINSIRKTTDFKTANLASLSQIWATELSDAILKKEIEQATQGVRINSYPGIYKEFIYLLASQSDLQHMFASMANTDYFKNLVNTPVKSLKTKYEIFEKSITEAAKFGAYDNISALLASASPEALLSFKRYLLRKTTNNSTLYLERFYNCVKNHNLLNTKEEVKYLNKVRTVWPQKPFAEKYLLEIELAQPSSSLKKIMKV